MTNLPFGFGPGGDNPFGGGDPSGTNPLGGLFGELQKLFSWNGGPVNWDLAKQVAHTYLEQLAQQSTPPDADAMLTAPQRAATEDAVRLADLWLDEVTELPSGVSAVESWTRGQWIDKTLPVWATLCDPVASHVTSAMSAILPEQAAAQAGPLAGLMNSFGGLMFGAQVGQALAGLAREVVSSTDVGLPLGPVGTTVLLPRNVATFGAGLERPEDEVRLYLALREAAHQRLFAHVPWLRQRLMDTVEAYAKGITVDTGALERAMSEIDPTNPESLQQALGGGLFDQDVSPEQQAALRRLETLLALVEGWVDTVVTAAADGRMPGAVALREAIRRRRASGGPAEETFSTLVGLELRPRRLREAAALWWAVESAHGTAARDGIWTHPDLMPDAEDLDDPLGFAEKVAPSPDDLSGLDG